MKHETLIIGSSPFAIKYAKHHQNVRVLERGGLLDPIFYGTLNGFRVSDKNNEYSLLFENTWEGFRDLGYSEVVLSEYVLNNKINVSFFTEIVKIERDSIYKVTYFDNGGLHTEDFERIIDCRTKEANNCYNIIVQCQNAPEGDFTLLEALGNNSYLLQFVFEKDVTVAEAKAKALEGIKSIHGLKWLTSASRTYALKNSDCFTDDLGILHLAPMSFVTPENAFKAGEALD